MIVPFVYALRAKKVPVGTQEAIALAHALSKGLHESSLEGFYLTARALLVHREEHLDLFDVTFSEYFRGVTVESKKITDEILSWLEDVKKLRELSEEEKALIEALDLETLQKMFEERLKEQRERHDGGSRWIGTGGTSPFGRGGYHPTGMSVGGGGGKGAVKSADARKYKGYRTDVVFDVRQLEVALRRLKAFVREGSLDELDVEGTIDATARNAGELEVVVRPPRRADTRVILAMDVGGSMDPYAQAVSQLFSVAKRATHWRELRTYYFHNCVYGRVFKTEGFADPLSVHDLMRQCGPKYKLILVGDALMAPYELLATSPDEPGGPPTAGIHWLQRLREHFPQSVWLNPEAPREWHGNTIEAVRQVFPMYHLTVEGLTEAVAELLRRR
ncbi:MAG: VWA domain-containing protein [Myxococcales bacterium]|nr:VWA domain-containing protein [Myxococcales bacterium]